MVEDPCRVSASKVSASRGMGAVVEDKENIQPVSFEALSARHGLDEAEIGPRERSADSGESGTHIIDSSLELKLARDFNEIILKALKGHSRPDQLMLCGLPAVTATILTFTLVVTAELSLI